MFHALTYGFNLIEISMSSALEIILPAVPTQLWHSPRDPGAAPIITFLRRTILQLERKEKVIIRSIQTLELECQGKKTVASL
jgi:hypothetical protein